MGFFVVPIDRDKYRLREKPEGRELNNITKKNGLPDDLKELLKQLVMNGSIRMAGMVLYAYCRRIYHTNDETAALNQQNPKRHTVCCLTECLKSSVSFTTSI